MKKNCLSAFQDQESQQRGRSKSKKTAWAHFKIRKVNNVAVQSLKRLPELSAFQDQASLNNVAVPSLKRLPERISRSGKSTMWPFEV